VIYTDEMAIKAALMAVPAVAMTIMVLLLNWVDAGPAPSVAGITLVAVAGGSLFGVFADRLPELPSAVSRRAEPRSR
jgi:hypothetical protein